MKKLFKKAEEIIDPRSEDMTLSLGTTETYKVVRREGTIASNGLYKEYTVLVTCKGEGGTTRT